MDNARPMPFIGILLYHMMFSGLISHKKEKIQDNTLKHLTRLDFYGKRSAFYSKNFGFLPSSALASFCENHVTVHGCIFHDTLAQRVM